MRKSRCKELETLRNEGLEVNNVVHWFGLFDHKQDTYLVYSNPDW